MQRSFQWYSKMEIITNDKDILLKISRGTVINKKLYDIWIFFRVWHLNIHIEQSHAFYSSIYIVNYMY